MYHHTQSGTVTRIAAAAALAAAVYTLARIGPHPILWLVVVVAVLGVFSLSSMTIEVDQDRLIFWLWAGVDPSLLPPSRDPKLGRGEESLVVRLGYPSDPARLALQRWGEWRRSTRAARWPAASGGHGRTRAPVRSH